MRHLDELSFLHYTRNKSTIAFNNNTIDNFRPGFQKPQPNDITDRQDSLMNSDPILHALESYQFIDLNNWTLNYMNKH